MVSTSLRDILSQVPPGKDDTLIRLYLSSRAPSEKDDGAVPPPACLDLNLGLVPAGLLTEGDPALSRLLWSMLSSVTPATAQRAVAKLGWLWAPMALDS